MPRDRRRSCHQCVDPGCVADLSFSKSEIELGEWAKVPTTYAGGAKGQRSSYHRFSGVAQRG